MASLFESIQLLCFSLRAASWFLLSAASWEPIFRESAVQDITRFVTNERLKLSSLSEHSEYVWTVTVDSEWDVLGPFPIHAREQHYLSPAFPLNLSEFIDFNRLWPSSYADGGTVEWSKATMAHDGSLELSFPDIRWATLRATEGWAALQHHVILRSTLTIYPPTPASASPPHLLVDLKQGSYFTIRPHHTDVSAFIPEWCAGNVYDMERAVPHALALPSNLSCTEPTEFDLFVSGDYEIRLFGDPLVRQSQIPVQLLSINVSVTSDTSPIQRQPSQDVICDFVTGYAFGDCLGVAIQSLSGWWTVNQVKAQSKGIHLHLLRQAKIEIAPTQTRIVPILISQDESYLQDFILLDIILESPNTSELLSVSLPIRHHGTLDQQTGICCSYQYVNSMPTSFLAIPPKSLGNADSDYPMLALHGAGVDIFTHEFWVQSLPDNKHGWTVIPSGRTSWGLDWHGPSAKDAWASLDALRSILIKTRLPERYGIPPDCKVIVIGHSNGGQGTWYLASRFPDRVLAAIPAAAYIKSQAYIPLTLSRSAHFIDPSLRSILESSFTPDDNDLHLSNLVDIPLLAIHGGKDENVPVWHTRETIALLKSLYPTKEVLFKEDSEKGHWYPDVLKNPAIESFLDRVTSNETATRILTPEFTLTVTTPLESGSLRGWRIHRLKIPGRVGKINIRRVACDSYIVQTSNVQAFSLPLQSNPFSLELDEQEFHFNHLTQPVGFNSDITGTWMVIPPASTTKAPPPGRLQGILSSEGPITIVISEVRERRELSLALRIAHILYLYHKLDSTIITEGDALTKSRSALWDSGNIVIIGRPSSEFVTYLLRQWEGPVRIVDSVVHVLDRKFDRPGQGALFTSPHPSRTDSFMLFLLYWDFAGLERTARLFPFRTGVATPDWIVLGERSDVFGAAGVEAAGVWANDWKINKSQTWFLR